MDRSEILRMRTERLKDATSKDFENIMKDCASVLKDIDPIRRRNLWDQKVLDTMHEQQQGLCGICREPMQRGRGMCELDHKIPFDRGGGNERANLQLAHRECNRRKGNSVNDHRALLRYLEDRYMNLR